MAIYCLADDLLKGMNHKEHNDRKTTDGQVITTALVSALCFRGNRTMSLAYMGSHVFDGMPKRSGFTKRLHKLKETLMFILLRIGRISRYMCREMEYIIGSFPVKACHNIRISRCKLFRDERYRGCNASKREHFYGVKIQLVTTADGIPVEMYLVQGAEHGPKYQKGCTMTCLPRVRSSGIADTPTMNWRTCSWRPGRWTCKSAGNRTRNERISQRWPLSRNT